MPAFRSKPVEIEAIHNVQAENVLAWLESHEVVYEVTGPNECIVTTEQGEAVLVREGEWIILDDTPGRAYPCDPVVFARKYEAIA